MPTPSSATDMTQCDGSSVMVMRTSCGRAWRTALLTASCAMRSSSCSCSGCRPVVTPPPSKVQVTPPGHGGAVGQLAQGELQARAARLVEAQRHDRATRLGEPVARQIADARQGERELRVALLAGGELLDRAQLHEDAGEGLREAVVDFLADAGALHEHRGFLGRVREPRQLHRKRRLLRERYQELAALHLRGVAAEGQDKEADAAGAEHQRVDHRADTALVAVEVEHARPDLLVLPC